MDTLNMNRFSLLFFLLMLVNISCDPDEPMEVVDTAVPMVSAISIEEGATFNSGENINVELTLSDDKELASYKVLVRNLATDELVFIKSEITNEKQLTINDSFSVEVAASTAFRLEIELEDATGKIVDVVRNFSILPPPGGVLSFNLKLKYDDQPLVMFDRYTYENNLPLFFTRFSMYFSEITLIRLDGEEVELMEVDFINLTDAHESMADAEQGKMYQIPGVPAGTYTGLKFTLGVPEDLNEQVPADFPPSSPLSKSGEYWSSWQSYIFEKTEGKMDIDGDGNFETGIALHIGSTDAIRRKSINVDFTITEDGIVNVPLEIDINKMLVREGVAYDLVNNPQIHSLEQLDLVLQLADNLIEAIN